MNDNFFDEIAIMAMNLGKAAASEGIDVLKFFQDEDCFGLNETARKSIEIGTSIFNSKGE